jgi:hypothetical protein
LRFFPLVLLLATGVFAEELSPNDNNVSEKFVLNNDNVLTDKSVGKINDISGELKAKTGVSVYISAVQKLEANQTIGAYAKAIANDLDSPYILIAVSAVDKQIDAVISKELESVIGKNDILCVAPACPIVPIIAKDRDDLSDSQKINVAVFYGAAYVAHTIAKDRVVALESSLNLFDEEFALNKDNVLIDRSVVKINEMSGELKAKTGVSVYISAVQKLEANQTIGAYAKAIANDLSAPYILIAVSAVDKQIDAVISKELESVISKDDILCITPGCPIIPILSETRRDLSNSQQISAGVFNGAAFIVDAIAENRDVTLVSSVGSGSKTFGVTLAWIVRLMIVLTLVAMFVAWRSSKTEGK